KIESFEWEGRRITNFEMESSAVAGLSKMMGHKALTCCMVIANRLGGEADTRYKQGIEGLIQTVLERL
ncbi:MAG: phosphorylase, partial [Alloprevotella sp.]|nr:phosphorylase [Alloprevotella sp.]